MRAAHPAAGVADQATETLRHVTGKASDPSDNASEYWSRYNCQGSRALDDRDTGTTVGRFIAGAIASGLGRLVYVNSPAPAIPSRGGRARAANAATDRT
jgi:hypothetical protein